MTTIALPERNILVPRLEFPAWLRRIGEPLRMFGGAFQSPFQNAFASSGAAANWWQAGGASGCVAAYQPKGAASLAASYVNLANPGTYNAAPGVAPTWDVANGWTGDGATQYLTAGFTPASGWSGIIRFSGASTDSKFLFAAYNGFTAELSISPRWGGTSVNYATNVVAGVQNSGVLAIANTTAYRNGVAETGTCNTGTSGTMHLFARYTTTVNSFFAGSIQACAFYSTSLTAGQVAAITTAMNAL